VGVSQTDGETAPYHLGFEVENSQGQAFVVRFRRELCRATEKNDGEHEERAILLTFICVTGGPKYS
jgi:hypothetical protein